MFMISFIFKPGTCDDEFRRLDAATQAVAADGRLPHLTSPIAKVRRPPGARDG